MQVREIYRRAVRKDDNDLFEGTFTGDSEDELMNIKLDFMILSLKLINMMVESKIKTGEEMANRNVFAYTKEYFYESFVLFNRVTDLKNDLVFCVQDRVCD